MRLQRTAVKKGRPSARTRALPLPHHTSRHPADPSPQDDNQLALCSVLATNIGDNNVNVSNTCCKVVARLAEVASARRLEDACEVLGEPLGEVFGNAKVRQRG